jgi:hypothetical protein
MEKLAEKRQRLFAVEEYGQVTGRQADSYRVETDSDILEACRAVSCLIEPQEGDKVLVCSGVDDRAYVLAILERPGMGSYEMNVTGDLTIASLEGSVSLSAEDTLRLASARSVEMLSPHLKASFQLAEVVFNKLLYVGQTAQATLSRIKIVAQVVESVVDRLHQVLKNSYRTVEESEHLRAGSINYLARKLMALRGRYTVITANKDVKIDGRHIHMG